MFCCFRVVRWLRVALHGCDGGEGEEGRARHSVRAVVVSQSPLVGSQRRARSDAPYPHEGDAREFAFQILGVAGAVGGMMQQRINVMKNVRPRDAVVVVENLEQRQRLGRDVVAPLHFLFVGVFNVAIKREAL